MSKPTHTQKKNDLSFLFPPQLSQTPPFRQPAQQCPKAPHKVASDHVPARENPDIAPVAKKLEYDDASDIVPVAKKPKYDNASDIVPVAKKPKYDNSPNPK